MKNIGLLVLLAFATLGKNSDEHLICERLESVFVDTQHDQTAPQLRIIQGSPGKRVQPVVRVTEDFPESKENPEVPQS